MREWIDQDRFELVIQPVVDLKTGKIIGGEVLSRLNHPKRGILSPSLFLPIINELNLYPQFDLYIFQKSCDWIAYMLTQEVELQFLACNFSRKTLSEADIVPKIRNCADSLSLNHSQMAIEITEQEDETDTDLFQANLKQLKEDGFQIFVDDFGAGVTSVKDLWHYPVDVVKIDRSILLASNTPKGETAFRGLVKLAATLGAQVLCEGIETEDQHLLAKNCRCHYGQGYLFSPPITRDFFDILKISDI